MNKVYEIITERFIKTLEKGVIPWKQPWDCMNMPGSYVSKKAYRGINTLLLSGLPYEHNLFLTFNQAKKLGGTVKKGEKGYPITFWTMLKKDKVDSAGKKSTSNIPFLRYYTVFNVEQIEGIEFKLPKKEDREEFVPIEKCEDVVKNFPDMRDNFIRHEEQRAYYSKNLDFINMPKKESFKKKEEYYSTIFHELTHATGAKCRLDRKTLSEAYGFGTELYAEEELVAEIGAAFLCSECSIETATLENSEAYIKNWISRLKNDQRLIVSSAGAAQKAADFILGRNKKEAESEEEVENAG